MTDDVPGWDRAEVIFHGGPLRLWMELCETEERCPSSRWDVDVRVSGSSGDFRTQARMSLWFSRATWDRFLRDLRSLTSPYDDHRFAAFAQLSSMGDEWCLRLAREARGAAPWRCPAFALSLRCRMIVGGRTTAMVFGEAADIDVAWSIDRAFNQD